MSVGTDIEVRVLEIDSVEEVILGLVATRKLPQLIYGCTSLLYAPLGANPISQSVEVGQVQKVRVDKTPRVNL
jgi:hypothetical protein